MILLRASCGFDSCESQSRVGRRSWRLATAVPTTAASPTPVTRTPRRKTPPEPKSVGAPHEGIHNVASWLSAKMATPIATIATGHRYLRQLVMVTTFPRADAGRRVLRRLGRRRWLDEALTSDVARPGVQAVWTTSRLIGHGSERRAMRAVSESGGPGSFPRRQCDGDRRKPYVEAVMCPAGKTGLDLASPPDDRSPGRPVTVRLPDGWSIAACGGYRRR